MGQRNKRQSNSSYEFAQRQNVMLDDYRVSFVESNNHEYLASISRLLKHVDNDEI